MKISLRENRQEFVRLAVKYLPHKVSRLLSDDDVLMDVFISATDGVEGLWYEGLDVDTMVELYQSHILACEGSYCHTLTIPEEGELGGVELWSVALKYEEKLFLDEDDFGFLCNFCHEDAFQHAEIFEKVFRRVFRSPSTILNELTTPRLQSTTLLLRALSGRKADFKGWVDASSVVLRNKNQMLEDGNGNPVLWDLIYTFCQNQALKQL